MRDDDQPAEIDFSKGTSGIHHSPSSAEVFVPASIERGVWDITGASGKRLHGFSNRSVPQTSKAIEHDYNTVMNMYGRVPGGMFGADENARPGYIGVRPRPRDLPHGGVSARDVRFPFAIRVTMEGPTTTPDLRSAACSSRFGAAMVCY
jgi:hypothetical protein